MHHHLIVHKMEIQIHSLHGFVDALMCIKSSVADHGHN